MPSAWEIRRSDPFDPQPDNDHDSSIAVMRTISDKRTRDAFVNRALRCISGYREARKNNDRDRATEMWHEFLSLPKRNLRLLKGDAHTSMRNAFQRGQLILAREDCIRCTACR